VSGDGSGDLIRVNGKECLGNRISGPENENWGLGS